MKATITENGTHKVVNVAGQQKNVFVKMIFGEPTETKIEEKRCSWGIDKIRVYSFPVEIIIDGVSYAAIRTNRVGNTYHYNYTYNGIKIGESDKKLIETILNN